MRRIPLEIKGGEKAQVNENACLGAKTPFLQECEKSWGHKVDDALKNRFKLAAFRPKQRDIILSILGGRDTLVVMPTGGGKSLCFQIPSLLSEGVTLVVSPLIALMTNQVDALKKLNLPAATLNSTVPRAEAERIKADIRSLDPKIKLLYVTPELIATSGFQAILEDMNKAGNLRLFVVDEAHCISQWGHDFRPAYQQMSFIKKRFSNVTIAAFTATATKMVREDVIRSLAMVNPLCFSTGFNRPNIFYEVRFKDLLDSVYADMREFIKSKPNQCGLIYCHRREDCDEIAAKLQSDGIKALSYHAKLKDSERDEVQRKWTQNEVHIIVATIAFGMGIDKPDVRFVIHHTLPKSLEGFYQESGRAGRDGQPSYSLLYYSKHDMEVTSFLISKANEEKQARKHPGDKRLQQAAEEAFEAMVDYCKSSTCRRKKILKYFNEITTGDICNKTCDACKTPEKVKRNLNALHAGVDVRMGRSHLRCSPTLLIRHSGSSHGSDFVAKNAFFTDYEFDDTMPGDLKDEKGYIKPKGFRNSAKDDSKTHFRSLSTIVGGVTGKFSKEREREEAAASASDFFDKRKMQINKVKQQNAKFLESTEVVPVLEPENNRIGDLTLKFRCYEKIREQLTCNLGSSTPSDIVAALAVQEEHNVFKASKTKTTYHHAVVKKIQEIEKLSKQQQPYPFDPLSLPPPPPSTSPPASPSRPSAQPNKRPEDSTAAPSLTKKPKLEPAASSPSFQPVSKLYAPPAPPAITCSRTLLAYYKPKSATSSTSPPSSATPSPTRSPLDETHTPTTPPTPAEERTPLVPATPPSPSPSPSPSGSVSSASASRPSVLSIFVPPKPTAPSLTHSSPPSQPPVKPKAAVSHPRPSAPPSTTVTKTFPSPELSITSNSHPSAYAKKLLAAAASASSVSVTPSSLSVPPSASCQSKRKLSVSPSVAPAAKKNLALQPASRVRLVQRSPEPSEDELSDFD